MGEILDIPLSDILIEHRLRDVDTDKVSDLAESITEIGLLNPITIDDKYRLIAGMHRYEAFKKLGILTIPAIIAGNGHTDLQKELMEIDENLIRAELHYLERGELLKRRKRIYEILHPETKVGALPGKAGGGKAKIAENAIFVPTFVEDTAKKVKKGQRTIYVELEIAEKLAPEVKEVVKELGIGKTEALKLAKMQDTEQRVIIQKAKERYANNDKKELKVSQLIRQIEREEKEEIKKQQFKEGEHFENHIVCGDSITLLDKITDKFFDLVITDPPYSTEIENYYEFLEKWIPKAIDKVKDSGRIFIFCGSYPNELYDYLKIFNSINLKGFTLSNLLVWHYRNNIGPSPKNEFKRGWQGIFYLYGSDAPHLDSPLTKDLFDHFDYSMPDGRHEIKYHSHQKPEKLIEQLIVLSTKRGDSIFDLFAGSGVIGLISSKLERYCLSIEIDNNKVAICKERGLIPYEL